MKYLAIAVLLAIVVGAVVRIPRETGQGFHGKLDTHSRPNWTGIPRETGHLR